MYEDLERRLSALARPEHAGCVAGGNVGLEKESLRVSPDGTIAATAHPGALGSALTHPHITTDFSEALLEFVTPPFSAPAETLRFLGDIHRFVQPRLGEEVLWAASMPCMVTTDEAIPIARYGGSNVGRMKSVYRVGLGHRYGRVMQIIAGVHFNYSAPEGFWGAYAGGEGLDAEAPATRSDAYFALTRNFQRLGWLVPLLFGSSPAVCRSFLRGRGEGFEAFDAGTLHLPWATALRMSDIGYKNSNQRALDVSYDDVEAYVDSLDRAIRTPFPEYERIGVRDADGYRQLNANLLQIENEYYSFIRPKQIARSGERPTLALRRRGVRYVEIRALDVNPFAPAGVALEDLLFLEAFMLLCMLHRSPPIAAGERRHIEENQRLVATRGREPGLVLVRDGQPVEARTWALDLLSAMEGVCALLDEGDAGRPYADALARRRRSAEDLSLTPSARILDEMGERDESFYQFAMRKSREHAAHWRNDALPPDRCEVFENEARRSLAEQACIEASDRVEFEEYLRRYFATDDRTSLLA